MEQVVMMDSFIMEWRDAMVWELVFPLQLMNVLVLMGMFVTTSTKFISPQVIFLDAMRPKKIVSQQLELLVMMKSFVMETILATVQVPVSILGSP